jgi:hypothetical protein
MTYLHIPQNSDTLKKAYKGGDCMELSLLLAKIIGLILMLVAVALLINKKNVDLLFSLYKHPEAVFVTGILETVLGVVFILNHNIWTLDFRGIITIVGWILLVRGIGRVLFPSRVTRMLKKFKKMQSVIAPLLIFVFLIGTYLAYMGFTG